MTAIVADDQTGTYVHWNPQTGIPHCGATTPAGGALEGHRDRTKATCPACRPEYEPGTLVNVHPGMLLLERNIREAKLDDAFIDSIKAVGVLEPITAVLNPDGNLLVRFGHRRTLAALEAGRDTVPVYVAGSDDIATDAEIARVIRQRDENTQRRGLTAAEEVNVVEQLHLFGLSAAQIAKQARIPRPQVDTAIRVSRSELASKATERHESLTLDQAYTVAEFEDDPEVAKALVVTAVDSPDQFKHVAQRARADRDTRASIEKVHADLEAAGVTVLPERPSYSDKVVRLSRLRNKPGGTRLTPKNHATCPGHVGWAEPARWEGDVNIHEAEYGCADPKKHAHHDDWGASTATSSRPKAAEMTDSEREAEREKRRLVIDNNKAWASAEKVRREWLAEFATAKTAPKGAAAFIVHAIATNAHALSDYGGPTLAVAWLNIKTSGTQTNKGGINAAAAEATEGRALQIALIQVIAAYETQLTKDAWRTDGKKSNAGAYLRFLEACGYGLSDVEKFATSSRTA